MVDDDDLTDQLFDCSANFDEDEVEKKKETAPLEESLLNGFDKAEECEKKAKISAAVDNNKEGPRAANESESNFGPIIGSDTGIIVVPATDFHDFDKDKREECFAVGQMWAMYGDDGMPRLYARIRKVFSPGFKVRITWLDTDPDDQYHIAWTREGFPVGCGKFIRDKSDKIEDIEMFSHTVEWEKGTSYASYRIYPRIGETWALFKNWNIKWISEPDRHRNFQYEFVVVLSDYTEDSGITVAYLVKIKGFVSLFKTTINNEMASIQIPPNELLRFSHRVPSYVTTGRERDGVPQGYFELDPASLPNNIEEISDMVDINMNAASRSTEDEKLHTPNQRTNPGENNNLERDNSKYENGSQILSNGYCNKKTSEENADHSLQMTTSYSDQVKSHDISDGKGIDLHPASLPGKLEEMSGPDVRVNVESIDSKINVSSRSLGQEEPHTPKKRKNPDEKNLLEGGNSKGGNGSPRSQNGCYKKKATEENARHSLKMTSSCSDQVSHDGSDGKDTGPDLASLPPINLEENSDHVDGKVNVENIDAKINDSSRCQPEERPHNPKKRKNCDKKFSLDGSNSESGKGSLRLSNGFSKKKPHEENAGHPVKKISSGSYQLKRLDGTDANEMVSDGLNEMCHRTFSSGEMGVLIDTVSFSHQSKRVTTGKKHEYEIYPRKGEVWALHRNFNSKWSCTDLYNKCEYDMVEVLEENVEMIKVLVLREVSGMKNVYKRKIKAGREFIMEIPRVELLRFSHQVLAFQLTNARLEGCWKLEPERISPLEESLSNEKDKPQEHRNIEKEAVAADDKKEGTRSGNDFEPNSGPNKKSDLVFLEVHTPDFYDFEMDKKEECFAVDQIWAIYDYLDCMPRFYALIRKVYSPGFKIKITHLEPDPDSQDEIDWTLEDLPVAYGKFKHGKSEKTENMSMFSHRVCWEKGTGISSYRIFPRKGETWALFMNWDIKWSSDPFNHRSYQYEFVEVLSDYTEESGIDVVYLVKIKGFVSLFKPTINNGMVSAHIPPSELLRFSHRVPSFRTTGREREDIPAGYFELHPASLPNNLEEISDPISDSSKAPAEESPHLPKKLKNRKNPNGKKTLDQGNSRTRNWCPRLSNWCHKKKRSVSNRVKAHADSTFGRRSVFACQADANEMLSNALNDNTDIVAAHTTCEAPNADFCNSELIPSSPFHLNFFNIPDAEFYNFEDDRSPEKFKRGQIWAVYCDLDDLPKYFIQIKRVELSPELKLCVKWLKSCSLPKDVINWVDKDMPICCGTFERGENGVFTDTAYFSHQSRGVLVGKEKKYEIYPRKGEVWALYKNFNSKWSRSDLKKCEYDLVEILEDQDRWTIVLVLQQFTSRFVTVFMSKKEAEHSCIIAIPRFELLRFSHQVPAFRMMEERYGSLRDSWVLDPKSIPACLFSSN